MLGATIAATFNTLQTILVVRKSSLGGLCFLDYLVLQEGAGFSRLISIVTLRGKIGVAARLWSVARLIAIVLVPILNITVMSKSSNTNAERTSLYIVIGITNGSRQH